MISGKTKFVLLFMGALLAACGGDDDKGGAGGAGGAVLGTGGAASGGAGGVATGGSGPVATGGTGGSATGGSVDFTTTVAGTKTIDKLTPAEAAQLCKDFEAASAKQTASLAPGVCKLAGLFSTLEDNSTQATCEAAVQSCLAEFNKPDTTEQMCEPITGCTASVAEVTKCLNDQYAAARAFFDALPTCEQNAKGSTEPMGNGTGMGAPMQPASCKAIETTCPMIADGPSSDSDSDI